MNVLRAPSAFVSIDFNAGQGFVAGMPYGCMCRGRSSACVRRSECFKFRQIKAYVNQKVVAYEIAHGGGSLAAHICP